MLPLAVKMSPAAVCSRRRPSSHLQLPCAAHSPSLVSGAGGAVARGEMELPATHSPLRRDPLVTCDRNHCRRWCMPPGCLGATRAAVPDPTRSGPPVLASRRGKTRQGSVGGCPPPLIVCMHSAPPSGGATCVAATPCPPTAPHLALFCADAKMGLLPRQGPHFPPIPARHTQQSKHPLLCSPHEQPRPLSSPPIPLSSSVPHPP